MRSRVKVADGSHHRRLAAGIVLGAAFAIIPKESVLAWCCLLGLLLTPASIISGLLAAAVFWPISEFAEPLGQWLGLLVLTAEPLQETWKRFFQLPGVPWTALNYSLVIGNALLSVIIAVPLYYTATALIKGPGQRLNCWYQRSWLKRWLSAGEIPHWQHEELA